MAMLHSNSLMLSERYHQRQKKITWRIKFDRKNPTYTRLLVCYTHGLATYQQRRKDTISGKKA
jgi:hypothetical protein